MGWTYTELNHYTRLEQVKRDHVYDATRYIHPIKTELIAHEWRPSTLYAIIKLNYLEGHAKAGTSKTFLRVDMIDCSRGQFGYKDMTEDCGPYVNDAPSAKMKELIFEHIPIAEGYAKDFRDRQGIKYLTPEQAAGRITPTQTELFA